MGSAFIQIVYQHCFESFGLFVLFRGLFSVAFFRGFFCVAFFRLPFSWEAHEQHVKLFWMKIKCTVLASLSFLHSTNMWVIYFGTFSADILINGRLLLLFELYCSPTELNNHFDVRYCYICYHLLLNIVELLLLEVNPLWLH